MNARFGNHAARELSHEARQESARAALSYIRSRADELDLPEDFPGEMDIHIHLPEGAIPKDGPSAGITMALAIISALTRRPVRSDLAMTGEITLRGRVLPIGGLKEKAVAAHRNHVVDVIIPYANVREIEELPQEVRDSIRFHPVRTMDDVLALALRGAIILARPPRRSRKSAQTVAEASVSAH